MVSRVEAKSIPKAKLFVCLHVTEVTHMSVKMGSERGSYANPLQIYQLRMMLSVAGINSLQWVLLGQVVDVTAKSSCGHQS